jgi:hypothetical protein
LANGKQMSEGAAFAVALCFGVAAILGSSVMVVVPRDSEAVAVFASPWAGRDGALQVIAGADARIVAYGKYDWIAVAYDDQPSLAERLYDAGAVFVADAALVSACTNLTETTNWAPK